MRGRQSNVRFVDPLLSSEGGLTLVELLNCESPLLTPLSQREWSNSKLTLLNSPRKVWTTDSSSEGVRAVASPV